LFSPVLLFPTSHAHLFPQGCYIFISLLLREGFFYFFIPLPVSNAFVSTVKRCAEFVLVLW